MKILQVCSVDFVLYHFLAPLVRRLVDANHEVVCACADGELTARVRAEGIRVESVSFSRSLFRPLRHWRAYRELTTLLARESFDIVHVHTPLAAMIGRLAAHRARVPTIVYTAHGFYFHDRMAGWKRRLFIGCEWLGGRMTHVLFTQAQEDADTARRHNLCRGGVIQAIGNGVDRNRFHPPTDPAGRTRLREQLGTSNSDCVIVVVGRLVAEKGYPELFDAMAIVHAKLWVVGSRLTSDYARGIDDAIDNVRDNSVLNRRIRFLGYRTDVPDLLRAADIFTLPSHREGMPRSIIEAMMTGLPVVAADIRGSREEVVPDETGLLVPVNDAAALARALERLVADPELRTAMGRSGRARALELYDEEKVIRRQMEVLGL